MTLNLSSSGGLAVAARAIEVPKSVIRVLTSDSKNERVKFVLKRRAAPLKRQLTELRCEPCFGPEVRSERLRSL